MTWETLLAQVRDMYRVADDRTISREQYLAMLTAFDGLVSLIGEIQTAYDTDFRRNLPGGGRSFPQVPSLSESIAHARAHALENDLFVKAGEGIAENLRAVLRFVEPADAARVLAPLNPVFANILAGNL